MATPRAPSRFRLLSAALAGCLLLTGCGAPGPVNERALVTGIPPASRTAAAPASRPGTPPPVAAPGSLAAAPATPPAASAAAPKAPENFPLAVIDKKAALQAPPPPAVKPAIPPAMTGGMTSTAGAPKPGTPPPATTGRTPAPPAAAPPLANPGVLTLPTLGPQTNVYRLKHLDQVVVQLKYPVLQTSEDVVDENGNITLPLLNDIKAAGFTTSELETEISRLYVEKGFYKSVIISVVVPSLNYTISGEVQKPGRYEIRGTVTLVQAIAEGGNFTEFANKKRIQIIRGGQVFEKNYNEILEDPRLDIEILPRDSIRVPRGW